MSKKYKKIPSVLGVVLGIKHHGKSTFIKDYLIPKLREKKPVVVLDPTGEFAAKFPELASDTWEQFIENLSAAGGFQKGVHVLKWKSNQAAINLIKFIRAIEPPVSLILDECHMLFDNSIIYTAVKNELTEVCFMGSHYGLDTILCTHRAYNLSINARSQSDFIVSFRQKEHADLEYLRKKGDAPADVKEKVAGLDKHQFFSIGEQPEGFTEIKINKVNKLKL